MCPSLASQGEESGSLNSTFSQRLHSLEVRKAEDNALFQVHASLLNELQAQLGNLSAAMQPMSSNTSCTINIIKTTPLLGMPDTLPPGMMSFMLPHGTFYPNQSQPAAFLPTRNTPIHFSYKTVMSLCLATPKFIFFFELKSC